MVIHTRHARRRYRWILMVLFILFADSPLLSIARFLKSIALITVSALNPQHGPVSVSSCNPSPAYWQYSGTIFGSSTTFGGGSSQHLRLSFLFRMPTKSRRHIAALDRCQSRLTDRISNCAATKPKRGRTVVLLITTVNAHPSSVARLLHARR